MPADMIAMTISTTYSCNTRQPTRQTINNTATQPTYGNNHTMQQQHHAFVYRQRHEGSPTTASTDELIIACAP